jgi:uncharacterized membrane protein
MDWAQVVVQWLHVLLGILWFGTVLYNATILFPAIEPLPLSLQRRFGSAIGERAFRIITPVALAVIVLGILRGTVFGSIRSLEALTSVYGITWLVSLAFAIGAFLWGDRVVRAALDRMNAIPESAALDATGQATPAFAAAIADVKRKAVLELGFFLVIFTGMILMRFGL